MSRFLCSLIAFLLTLHAAMAMTVSPHHEKIKLTCKTITVDPSRKDSFQTIQAAVESVPLYNSNWICIRVKQGIYRERVYFTYGRSFIYLVGEGMERTYVVSDGHSPFDSTATFTTRTDNLIVEGLSFNNTYNQPPSRNPMGPSAAGKIEGDKLAFYGCGFYGLQDTLWDVSGRHYFNGCTIEGAVDFIFGAGQSIYEKCVISVVAKSLRGAPGFITAHARGVPTETSGFVFKYCAIIGDGGPTYLGRPWRKYARVIFYQTNMSSIVVPQGWFTPSDPDLTTFVEVKCFGPGSNTSGRPTWEKKLSDADLNKFISLSYINQDGWLMPN